MLKRGLCCLILPTFLFTTSSSIVPFQTKPLMDRELNNNSYYIDSKMDKQLKEYLKEQEKIRLEEIRLKELEVEKRKNEESKEGIPVRLLVTYYGNTTSQCGNSKGIMANGDTVHYGSIAVPYSIPLGSKIIMDKSGREFIAKDRGNSKYICELGENYYRVDIFIPKNEGESISAYEDRVRVMGTDDVTAKIIIKE